MDRAFDEAFEEYSIRGLRYATSMLRSSADAEEVVQEAFCRLMLSRHKVEVTDDFAAVFFTTVRNLCMDLIRKRKRRPEVPIVKVSEISANQSAPGSSDDVSVLKQAIQEAINDLPDNWADALKLRINANLSYEEISAVLKCTRSQVRTWIYRARRQLEQALVTQGLLGRLQSTAQSK